MKCPKCAYVGFEESDRCRHCGYDFSLSASPSPVAAPALDPAPAPRPLAATPPPVAEWPPFTADTMSDPSAAADVPDDLPLRAPSFPMLVHETQPPPARTPLAVRRQSAERPRNRSAAQVVRRSSSPLLEIVPDVAAAPDQTDTSATEPAPRGLRLLAALIDVLLLAGIDLAVVYLTTQLAGMAVAEAAALPMVPLAVFLLGLNGGYLAVFTAKGGQTLGKMATGLRVVPMSGALSFGDAVVRVAVAVVGGAAAGAGFVPALLRADRRALHDYAAQTCVVKVSN